MFALQDYQNRSTKSKSRLLIEILSTSWRDNPLNLLITEQDLRTIRTLIHETGSGGLGWWRIRQFGLKDSTVGLECQQAFRVQTLQMIKQEFEIKNLFENMRKAGAEPILVKGWAMNRLYPAKGLRPCGDIDLILRPCDLAKAKEVMNSSKGKKPWVDFEHEEFEKLDEQSMDDLFAHSQLVKLGDTDVRVMSDEDHLRFLCIHLLRHGAWRPLWFCDIAVAVESRGENFDWQHCLGKDKRQADWVLCTIRLAHELLGADISNTPAENKKLPKWLLPTTLKQWEYPCAADHAPPELIMTSLRHPTHILKAIRDRWPDPISASIRMNAPFNEFPRLPFQVANYIVGLARFAGRLLKLLIRK
jgi:hypothetical protein